MMIMIRSRLVLSGPNGIKPNESLTGHRSSDIALVAFARHALGRPESKDLLASTVSARRPNAPPNFSPRRLQRAPERG